MSNSTFRSLNTVSRNNEKVDRALDALIESAQGTENVDRSDQEELEKTSRLMLFLGLMAGDSDSQTESDSQ